MDGDNNIDNYKGDKDKKKRKSIEQKLSRTEKSINDFITWKIKHV